MSFRCCHGKKSFSVHIKTANLIFKPCFTPLRGILVVLVVGFWLVSISKCHNRPELNSADKTPWFYPKASEDPILLSSGIISVIQTEKNTEVQRCSSFPFAKSSSSFRSVSFLPQISRNQKAPPKFPTSFSRPGTLLGEVIWETEERRTILRRTQENQAQRLVKKASSPNAKPSTQRHRQENQDHGK